MRRAPWHIQFVVLAAMWGLSFLFIKIGDESLAPLQVAFGRLVFGAATLLLILGVGRSRLPRGFGVWRHLVVAALLFNVLPFSFYAYGETRISSVLAGIWNATTPLLTLLVAILALPQERPTRARTVGMAIGFAGVLVVLGAWRGLGGRDPAGNLLCIGAAACYAVGYAYTRRYLSARPEPAVSLAAAQVLCGAAELALITPFVTAAPSSIPFSAWTSLLALGALGTGVAYVLNYNVIRHAGATVASTVTYLIPVFATVAGIVFLREPVTWNEPAGALIIILGAAVSQGGWRRLILERDERRRFRAAARLETPGNGR
ncbi:MAG TPA: DMT family transporter [Candidatus Sulfotelmatobacter sp.]|nr:DMT family transporter [Candidatus Sulfotelmatobacter sp.]